MAWSLARRIPERTIELREHVRVGERVDPYPDCAVGQRVHFDRRQLDRPARVQGNAARYARAAILSAGHFEE